MNDTSWSVPLDTLNVSHQKLKMEHIVYKAITIYSKVVSVKTMFKQLVSSAARDLAYKTRTIVTKSITTENCWYFEFGVS